MYVSKLISLKHTVGNVSPASSNKQSTSSWFVSSGCVIGRWRERESES